MTLLDEIKTRATPESNLLAMVVIGADADITELFNTTDIPQGEISENVRAFQDFRDTKQGLRDRLGDEPAGALLAGLRVYGKSEAEHAALVNESVIAMDAGGLCPNLGDPAIRAIITAMGTASAFNADQATSQAIAATVLALAPKAKIAHKIKGRLLRVEEVTAALAPVRLNGTTQLNPGWNNG